MSFWCRVLIVACAMILTGCSSIGTINGTQLDNPANSDHPQICANYEWVCIGAGIAAFGGVVWALQENGHHGD
jgi:starvation-inducible outer membrane lipoprotein